MKGPMKGAAIGHAKQRNTSGCYLGLTEPGIIASESPNPIVNSLVVMPDIENGWKHSSALATPSLFSRAEQEPWKNCSMCWES